MPSGRTRGIKETKPRAPGAGRKSSQTFAQRHAADPHGATTIALHLANATLAYIEQQATQEEVTVQEWIRQRLNRAEIESRIV